MTQQKVDGPPSSFRRPQGSSGSRRGDPRSHIAPLRRCTSGRTRTGVASAPSVSWPRVLGFVVGLVARLWIATLRLTQIVDPALAQVGLRPWVFVFWHGQQFALLKWKRRRRTVALVSLSRDGDLQASALPRLGLVIERGSSSRGGARGLMAIVRRLRRDDDAAFAVDGPRGPCGVVRASEGGGFGAALAASRAGGILVPMAAASADVTVLQRTWDRFELPLPFSRVAVVLGPPLNPDDAGASEVSQAIDAARRAAVAAVGPRGSRGAVSGRWPPLQAARPGSPAPPTRCLEKARSARGRGALR